jgi:hypothetical protein
MERQMRSDVFQAYMQLASFNREVRAARMAEEWRFYAAIWAGLGGGAYFLATHPQPFLLVLAVAAVIVFLDIFAAKNFYDRAERGGKRMWLYHDLAQAETEIDGTKKRDLIERCNEEYRDYRPTFWEFLTNYSIFVQLSITLLLSGLMVATSLAKV